MLTKLFCWKILLSYPYTCTEKPLKLNILTSFSHNYLFRFIFSIRFSMNICNLDTVNTFSLFTVTYYLGPWSHGGDDGIRTHDPLLAGQVLSQLSYTPKLLWFVVVSVFTPLFSFSFQWKVKSEEVNFSKSIWKILVGPSGLEPPTSCLSGTRSNLLSYDPLWLVSSKWSFFTWIFRVKGRFKLPSSLCQHWAIFPYSFP